MSRSAELLWVADTSVRSESPAHAVVPRALTGKARFLYELATGESPTGAHVTLANPQGEHGVDLSGPPWGSAVRHPIAWVGGIKTNANVQAPGPAITVNSTSWIGIAEWQIVNRQHEQLPWPSVAPYSRAEVNFRAYLSGAGTRTLTLSYRSNAAGDARQALSETFSVTSTAEASFEATKWVSLLPGVNLVTILAKVDSVASNHVLISNLSLNQIKKRSW